MNTLNRFLFAIIATLALCVAAPAAESTAERDPAGKTCLIGLPMSVHEGQTTPFKTFQLMREAGVGILEFRPGWHQMESAPGKMDLKAVQPLPMLDLAAGIYKDLVRGAVVTIKMIETTRRTMPADLMNKPFDDPEVMRRFDIIIDQLAQHPQRERVTHFVVGQEADVYLTLHPDELDAFETFYKHVVERVHSKLPGVRVGMSMTFNIVKNNPAVFDRLAPHGDLLVYTYYPMDGNFIMRPTDQVAADLRFLADRSGDRPFAFQEVGYSASPVNEGSEPAQAEFLRQVFLTLDPYRRSGQLRFLQHYMLFDYPPHLAEVFAKGQKQPDERFLAYISTLGLRQYLNEGAPRAAWAVFVQAARAWSQGADLPNDF